MNRRRINATLTGMVAAGLIVSVANLYADDLPSARMRSIDAPSAVDQYRRPSNQSWHETGYQRDAGARAVMARPASASGDVGTVRHAAWQQPMAAPQLPGGMQFPPGGFTPPADSGTIAPPSSMSVPPSFPEGPSAAAAPPSAAGNPPPIAPPMGGRALPSAPPPIVATPLPGSAADMAPLVQPQLDHEFATIANCNCVSPPSSYVAASGIGCGTPTNSYSGPAQAYVPPPAEIAAPVTVPVAPVAVAPVAVASQAAPCRPLFTFGQEKNVVQVGQGIIGQPVAYVPGQRIRNFIRYVMP